MTLAETDILDLLASLVDKSLVVQEETSGGRMRYRLLETVLAFGRDELDRAGETEQRSERHLGHMLERARTITWTGDPADSRAGVSALVPEHDNLVAAMVRARRYPGQRNAGLELATTLRFYWDNLGHYAQGRGAIVDALRDDDTVDPVVAARARFVAAELCLRGPPAGVRA